MLDFIFGDSEESKAAREFDAFRESISNAIEAGSLEQRMDTFKLRAVELGLGQHQLESMIEEVKLKIAKAEKDRKRLSRNKNLLYAICAVAVIIEWVFGLRGDVSFWTVIDLIVANLITLVVIVFVISYLLNIKKD